jgi:hypothetical protein
VRISIWIVNTEIVVSLFAIFSRSILQWIMWNIFIWYKITQTMLILFEYIFFMYKCSVLMLTQINHAVLAQKRAAIAWIIDLIFTFSFRYFYTCDVLSPYWISDIQSYTSCQYVVISTKKENYSKCDRTCWWTH